MAEACSNLAVLYKGGLGVTKDEEHAADLYAKACDLGDMDSCKLSGFRKDTP
jgi:uncharacterized protein